ncbi:YwaF family protein [Corynebacterium sp. 320]|uniref:YwaF family protein n=1 Tax=Corynebacterium zhongnanshanii TaxID=2768834 RepID=A0ABQ6VF70_9CORY|nr:MULTISPECIES: hypothetical protein [Corynebacterium]KAB1504210.1 YwaF family protein [Corynebacterium sp. 320]KAB1552690.1 YwaF family protein [Corynebacterium sp. 321]KAB1554092.1 YwaF family protein [Corynebacterium sp. 319]KAB3522935.1 YwaF family protein [Corynebacterium zhongnanshanii]KAB3528346.1 YwaF family protein [Corynebacterium sp. 250]
MSTPQQPFQPNGQFSQGQAPNGQALYGQSGFAQPQYTQPGFGQTPYGQAPFNAPNGQMSSAGAREKISAMSNKQLYAVSMAFVVLVLWGLRFLTWVKVVDETQSGMLFKGNGALQYVSSVAGGKSANIPVKPLGIYTTALLLVMILSVILCFFDVHFKRAVRLGAVAIIAYLVVSSFLYILTWRALSDPDIPKIVPGVGLIFTWIFLALIIGGYFYFLRPGLSGASQGQSAAWTQAPQQNQYPGWAPAPQPQQPQMNAAPAAAETEVNSSWPSQNQAAQNPAASESGVEAEALAETSEAVQGNTAADSSDDDANPWASLEDDSEEDNNKNPWA